MWDDFEIIRLSSLNCSNSQGIKSDDCIKLAHPLHNLLSIEKDIESLWSFQYEDSIEVNHNLIAKYLNHKLLQTLYLKLQWGEICKGCCKQRRNVLVCTIFFIFVSPKVSSCSKLVSQRARGELLGRWQLLFINYALEQREHFTIRGWKIACLIRTRAMEKHTEFFWYT